jgi:hypothetical protein
MEFGLSLFVFRFFLFFGSRASSGYALSDCTGATAIAATSSSGRFATVAPFFFRELAFSADAIC